MHNHSATRQRCMQPVQGGIGILHACISDAVVTDAEPRDGGDATRSAMQKVLPTAAPAEWAQRLAGARAHDGSAR